MSADEYWRDDALCARGWVDPEIFFPPPRDRAQEAKEVCRRCEVAEECLAWALKHRQHFGVWGGKSERERQKIRRDRPASAQLLCRNGHDLNVVGTDRYDNCVRCNRDRSSRYDRKRRSGWERAKSL
jgi:WhiB family redox-sensing transcriptional regulator